MLLFVHAYNYVVDVFFFNKHCMKLSHELSPTGWLVCIVELSTG